MVSPLGWHQHGYCWWGNTREPGLPVSAIKEDKEMEVEGRMWQRVERETERDGEKITRKFLQSFLMRSRQHHSLQHLTTVINTGNYEKHRFFFIVKFPTAVKCPPLYIAARLAIITPIGSLSEFNFPVIQRLQPSSLQHHTAGIKDGKIFVHLSSWQFLSILYWHPLKTTAHL